MPRVDSRRALQTGVFVIAGLALFAVGLFLIGDRRLLFAEQYQLETSFTKVTGLQVGTKVRVSGMDAGEVLAIEVPTRPSEPFVIRMRVKRDLSALVRTDSVATIQVDGLVGNAFVQLARGTDEAAIASPGSRIPGRDPTELSDVLQRAADTLSTFERVVDRVGGEVARTLTDVDATVQSVNRVADAAHDGVLQITASASRSMVKVEDVIGEAHDMVADIRGGQGTIGKLVTDDALYANMRQAADRAGETIENMRATTARAREGVERLLAQGGLAEGMMTDLRGVAAAAEEVLSDLAESTEAIKRNVLVRGFFRNRGFYDIDALTPLEYRRFAAESDKRRVLRIWLGADVLFAGGGSGDEQITSEGRARLELAMGTFLEYRRDSPLVVEGYATTGSTSAQFLRSDARARIVRDHLVRRFRRDAAITGAIGLASDAQAAPSGSGRWDGVALALLVPK